jgi:hypothetical protein
MWKILSNPNIINSIGLVFDIAGIIMLFCIDYDNLILSGKKIYLGGPGEKIERSIKRKAKIGLILIVIGFIFQLVGNLSVYFVWGLWRG